MKETLDDCKEVIHSLLLERFLFYRRDNSEGKPLYVHATKATPEDVIATTEFLRQVHKGERDL